MGMNLRCLDCHCVEDPPPPGCWSTHSYWQGLGVPIWERHAIETSTTFSHPSNRVRALAFDPNGNLYVATPSADGVPPGTAVAGMPTISAWDSAGGFLWRRTFPAGAGGLERRGTAVAADASYVYLGTELNMPPDVQGGNNLHKLNASDGSVVWSIQIESLGVINAIAFDGSGNLYVTGNLDTILGIGEEFVWSVDADGALRWKRGKLGGGNDILYLDGKVYIAGVDNDFEEWNPLLTDCLVPNCTEIHVRDAATGDPLFTFGDLNALHGVLTITGLATDGTAVYAVGSGEACQLFAFQSDGTYVWSRRPWPHVELEGGLTFSASGLRVAHGSGTVYAIGYGWIDMGEEGVVQKWHGAGYDTSGVAQFCFSRGTLNEDAMLAVAADTAGNFAVGGAAQECEHDTAEECFTDECESDPPSSSSDGSSSEGECGEPCEAADGGVYGPAVCDDCPIIPDEWIHTVVATGCFAALNGLELTMVRSGCTWTGTSGESTLTLTLDPETGWSGTFKPLDCVSAKAVTITETLCAHPWVDGYAEWSAEETAGCGCGDGGCFGECPVDCAECPDGAPNEFLLTGTGINVTLTYNGSCGWEGVGSFGTCGVVNFTGNISGGFFQLFATDDTTANGATYFATPFNCLGSNTLNRDTTFGDCGDTWPATLTLAPA